MLRVRAWGVVSIWLAGALPAAPAAAPEPLPSLDEYQVHLWREADGLPQDFVYTVLQTRDGYLWLGTRRGLARFDGVRFTVYDDRRSGELPDSEVRALAEDEDGSLWIGTGGGLARLREGRLSSFTTADGLPNDTVTSLSKEPGGGLWIGTLGGLATFDGRRFATYHESDGLPGEAVYALHRDGDGVLWIGTGRGLASYTAGKVVNHTARYPALGGTIRALAGGGGRGLWLDGLMKENATVGDRSEGLRRFKDGVVERFTVRDGLPSDEVTALVEGEAGSLWVGTMRGVARYRNGRLEAFAADAAPSSEPSAAFRASVINTLYVDREGNVWAGTRFDGLARLRETMVSRMGAGDTGGVFEDRTGAVWVAGRRGLRRFGVEPFAVPPLPEGVFPTVMGEDDEGRLLVGTNGGVFRLRGRRFEPLAGGALTGMAVTVLLNDGRGSVWIGGRTTGLYQWRDGVVTRYTAHDGLPGEQVRAIAGDSRGRLWVGTRDGGLGILADGRFSAMGVPEGLPSLAVSALHVDERDVVWAATRRGLARIQDGKVVALTGDHGLPARFFYQIVADGDALWLTFAGGIARVARAELDAVVERRAATARATVYGADDGIRNTTMTITFQPAAVRARDGRLWFATGDGAAVIDPARHRRNLVVPAVHVEDVRSDGRSWSRGTDVRIDPGRGDLEIHYTAASFVDPSRVEFRYLLEGFDRDWVEAGTRRVAYYTNLPPGSYRFRVVASNNDGLWNHTGASVEVRLRPHFYQTPWFYGAAVVLLAVAAAAAHRARVSRLHRRSRELSARVEEGLERDRILRWAKDEAEAAAAEARDLADATTVANLKLEREVTERRRTEEALRESEQRLRELAENIDAVFWMVEQGTLVYVSPAFERIAGRPVESVLRRPLWVITAIHREDRPRVVAALREGGLADLDLEYRLIRPDDSLRWVRTRSFPVKGEGGTVRRIVGISQDITDRKRAEEMIRHQAYHDELTGLPNRLLFADRFERAYDHVRRMGQTVALLFLDLDRFKTINDTLGHAVGDRLLRAVAERLQGCLRVGDTVARFGGDEFIVLVIGKDGQDVAHAAERILQILRPPFHLGPHELHITASIGVSVYPDDGTELEALVKNADTALYRAKESGRNVYQMYSPAMNALALEQLALENDLREALGKMEFLLHYQPEVALGSGRVIAVEALIRWRRRGRETLLPQQFIPVAEDVGLIGAMGEWVLRTACEQSRIWRAAGLGPLRVAVNLSPREFERNDVVRVVEKVLSQTGLDPGELELELTEGTVMRDAEGAVRTIRELKSMGVLIAIDDFGTGHSSLSYLKRFPVDALKIDRSFVRDLLRSTEDAAIVRAVITLAHSLGIEVVAEGVETREQLEFLRDARCDIVQGYYLGVPMPPEGVAGLVGRGGAVPA